MKIERGLSSNEEIQVGKGKLQIKAFYDEKGEIKTEQVIYENNKKEYEERFTLIISIVLGILNVILCMNNYSKLYMLIPIFALLLIETFKIVSILKDTRIRKNHSAEHMVIDAVNRKNRKVTIDEIKKEGMLDKRCGTNIFPTFIMYNIITIIISIVFNINVSFIIVWFLFKFSYYRKPFAYLGYSFQRFYLKKPDETSLKLAKAASDLLVDLQEK